VDVLRLHTATYPELATAQIEGPILVEGRNRYNVVARIGTKG
jgi:PRTRC genetic system protein C